MGRYTRWLVFIIPFALFISAAGATSLGHRVSGRVESMSGGFTMPGTTKATLPASETIRTVSAVTDLDRSLWMSIQTPIATQQWFSLTGKIINVQAYGADPSAAATTNDTAFSDAIAAANAGDAILVPCNAASSQYQISAAITVAKALTIFSPCNAEIKQNTAATAAIDITASNVVVRGVKLTGPQYSSAVSDESGVRIYGASSAAYISSIRIENMTISTWGDTGISCKFCEHVSIKNNKITNTHEYGIGIFSGRFLIIDGNDIDGIGGSDLANEAWSIALTKNTGTSATYPVTHDVVVSNNIVQNNLVWTCYDTHGGYNLTFTGNQAINCRRGWHIGSYQTNNQNVVAPKRVTVTGNFAHNDGTIAANNTENAIIVSGHSQATFDDTAEDITITGNVFRGYGDGDSAAGNSSTIVAAQNVENIIIADNIIYGRDTDGPIHGINFTSAVNLQIKNNYISGISSTDAAQKAIGSFVFSGLPNDADTITLGGAAFTFKNTPTTNFHIQIGASAEATIDNSVTKINAITDGRVYKLVTASKSGTDTLVITFNFGGESGNFYTIAESATNVTVSDATLGAGTQSAGKVVAGAKGSSAIYSAELSASSIVNTGRIEGNIFDVKGDEITGIFIRNTAIATTDAIHFFNNRITNPPVDGDGLVTGALLYDAGGNVAITGGVGTLTDTEPQQRIGDIEDFAIVKISRDLGSIAAAGSEIFYVPVPGMGDNSLWFAHFAGSNRNFQGLTITAAQQMHRLKVEVFNPTAGAIDLASAYMVFKIAKKDVGSLGVSD